MIKKIFFIGDFYRGNQERNVKVLYELISPVFFNLNIDVRILPEMVNISNQEKWHASLSGIGESILDTYNLDSTAIIGFELNPIDIDYLNSNNIPWLNFEIHPLRFLDDLYFNITSSFAFDFSKLSVNENSIRFAANTIKLKNLNGDFPIKENSLLIVGQSPHDKSVFFDGEFKSLLSYLEALREIIKEYDNIYYRSHPNLSSQDVDAELVRRFDVKSLNHLNYYDALSSEKLVAVCGISSSCLYEALYFDKKVTFLEKRKKQFLKPVKLQKVLECSELWFNYFLLAPDLKRTLSVTVPENLCRDAYGYWAYETALTKITVDVQQAKFQAREAVIGQENLFKQTDMQFDRFQEQFARMEAGNTAKLNELCQHINQIEEQLVRIGGDHAEVRTEVAIIGQQLAQVEVDNADVRMEAQLLSQQYPAIQRDLEETREQFTELIEHMKQRSLQFTSLISAYKQTDEIMRSQLQNVCVYLMNLHTSWGWRITAPFRALGGLLSNSIFPRLEFPSKIKLLVDEFDIPTSMENTIQLSSVLASNKERESAVFNSFARAERQHQRATTLAELLSFDDEDFVVVSYLTILGREPDIDGRTYYLSRLRAGCSKLQLMKQLRRSDEAQRNEPGITGLDRRIRQYSRAQLPFIGFFLRWLWDLESNSVTMCRLRAIQNEIAATRHEYSGLMSAMISNIDHLLSIPANPPISLLDNESS
ncbi:DUF4214 domain-containing protein [Legionella lytica]|uniref:DUF4214 domain-containing protein n=1 Tax=Legionella lytica TaxID=96232 RepID=A0ABW8DBQ9_9GAMM